MAGTRKILGLAVDDCGVVAAELHVGPERTEVHRSGEFSWSQEFTPDNAREMGLQLRRFLNEQGFSARRAVVGLPARWVLAKEIVVPPAGPDALAGMLSIQAERAFSLNASEMVFDYCGRTSASEKCHVLLLAAQRRMIEQIRELADAAGLQVQSVTVTAMACSRVPLAVGVSATCGSSDEPDRAATGPVHQCGLHIRPTYCEFWSQPDDRPRAIRHVPMSGDGTPDDHALQLSSAIGRLILLSPGQDPSLPHQVIAYDACGLSDATIDRINEQLGPRITVRDSRTAMLPGGFVAPEQRGGTSGKTESPETSWGGSVKRSLGSVAMAVLQWVRPSPRPTGLDAATPSPDFAFALGGTSSTTAVAVAMTVLEAGRPGVNFLNPRIGRKRTVDRKRMLTWAGSIAAGCVIVLGAIVVDWYGDRRAIAAHTEQLEQMSEEITAARAVVERVSYAGSWTAQDPRFLDCLRELTLAFPDEPTVWVTSLAVDENGGGMLIGKATGDASFYQVLDKITQNEVFSDVQMVHFRNAGRDSREKEFAISFTFGGAK